MNWQECQIATAAKVNIASIVYRKRKLTECSSIIKRFEIFPCQFHSKFSNIPNFLFPWLHIPFRIIIELQKITIFQFISIKFIFSRLHWRRRRIDFKHLCKQWSTFVHVFEKVYIKKDKEVVKLQEILPFYTLNSLSSFLNHGPGKEAQNNRVMLYVHNEHNKPTMFFSKTDMSVL